MTKEREMHGYGRSTNSTYSKYQAMKQRCTNPKHKDYPNYGGRGIKVCDRWMNSFVAFLEDMGDAAKEMTIERAKVNEDYEPGNCHWATKHEQSRNRRDTVRVVLDGVDYGCLKDASVAFGLSYGTVRVRTATYGWSIERALKTPIDSKKRRHDLPKERIAA